MQEIVKSEMNSVLIVGIFLFLGVGLLLVLTSRNSERNALTRLLFKIWTVMPRAGSMTDQTWVMINGIGLLLGGAVFVVLLLLQLST